ncbi:non-ribosomal peptide synthetase [Paenibacillus sp. FSL H7-689]|uniref:non-ribosomal peptide synthetase n=1 Tax=Paenibacillus sp. FSL H7-689 TaxID=1227349 RepID=UPI0003E2C103|nr:non-ribosomal peptide synthetase [Paenibacillus sp. FSL H7-689]ETT55846.1 lichenysin synthetase A [Paenibacillus sp. FSL H7-689]
MSVVYNLSGGISIQGELDVQSLRCALNTLIQRHESLRTEFELDGMEVMQRVRSNVSINMEYALISENALHNEIQSFPKPFDLNKAPLIRARLLGIAEQNHVLLLDMHHIITDGFSMKLFVQELISLYWGEELPEVSVQYKEFAAWHNKYLDSEDIKIHERYWIDVFGDEVVVLDLPTDYPRSISQSFEGNHHYFNIDKQLSLKLEALGRDHGVTLHMIMFAAYNVLLSIYSAQEDIIVGTPTLGRADERLNYTIGMFVNTLAIRSRPQGENTFVEFLADMKGNLLSAYEHEHYPFERLVEAIDIKRDGSRNPLFDTMFMFQNLEINEVSFNEINFKPFEIKTKTAKFDLTMEIIQTQDGLSGNIEYSTKLFTAKTIERMENHYQNLLRSIVENPACKLSELLILSEQERVWILHGYNETAQPYPKNKRIHELFEEQVLITPDKIAVEHNDIQMSYSELNSRSNQLARVLVKHNITSESLVGILLGNSVEVVISILAILKAGAAYLPIDPEYPVERVEYILNNSGTELIITDSAMPQAHFAGQAIDVSHGHTFSWEEDSNLRLDLPADGRAYVIYTSGTTGNPKGVMIKHSGLVNYIWWAKKIYIADQPADFPLYSSISFDLTVTSLFTPLVSGNKIIVYEGEDKAALIKEIVKDNRVGIIKLTPTHMKLIADMDFSQSIIRAFIVGGEDLKTALALSISRAFDGAVSIYNEYGPTETVVGCMIHKYDPETDDAISVPIGIPADNTQIYLLDSNLRPVPLGAYGEIYISGSGVALGYLNNERLSRERFIDNPFIPQSKMYKTGDIARFLPNGNMQYEGRSDQQVKIRGYRIELGEIESHLLKHPVIEEAKVISMEEDEEDTFLCAYYVAKSELTTRELRRFLLEFLPAYMVPTHFVEIDNFPISSNGKINVKELPNPYDLIHGQKIVAPTNELEVKLVELWKEIIQLSNVGIDHNFFEIGGHSLKAALLIVKINEQFSLNMNIQDIFRFPTIRELAEEINHYEMHQPSMIERTEKREWYPLSPAQMRMFVMNRLYDQSTVYNMPYAVMIEGQLNVSKFEQALNYMVQRHEILRTSFDVLEGLPVQIVHDGAFVNIQALKYENTDLQQIIGKFIRPFNLQKSPLIRVGMVRLEEQKHLFIFDAHHIIWDGVSSSIFVQELSRYYDGKSLNPINLHYKDFAVWINNQLNSGMERELEDYWMNKLAGELPILDLQTDYPRPTENSFAGDRKIFHLDKVLLDELRDIANYNNSTLYMVLLSAFNVLLAKYTGQQDIIIGSPAAGRIHNNIQHTIGMFVNTLVMRNQPRGNATFREFLNEVRENCLSAFNHQSYPFEKLVKKMGLEGSTERNPLFDVMFVMQNTDTHEFHLDDLTFIPFSINEHVSKFDFTLIATEDQHGLELILEYSVELFKEETIHRMAEHLMTILKRLKTSLDCPLHQLNMLSQQEEHQLLLEFNDTDREQEETYIHQMFEEQAQRTPDGIAIVKKNSKMTFQELDTKTNQLARLLRSHGAKSETIVGILADASMESIVGLLGVLKSGAAYLPLSPSFPIERTLYMLEDCKAPILLKPSFIQVPKGYKGIIINLDEEALSEWPSDMLEPVHRPHDLAYIIYTSGTTGVPKGVMIEHRAFASRIQWQRDQLDLTASDSALQLFPFIFDGFNTSFFTPLLSGSKIILMEEQERKDPHAIRHCIVREKVSYLISIPSLFQVIIDNMSKEDIQSLRKVVLAGEKMTKNIVEQSKLKHPDLELINEYGPTEGTIVSTVKRNIQPGEVITIGKPIANTKIYILDLDGNLVPVGVPGELCIAGVGLARGYLNQDQLTSAKFVINRFAAGQKIYKTGDVARWNSDGEIEYLGRTDHQVKIRGYRIEVGEIEHKLLELPEINAAVVVARQDTEGNSSLRAYFVASERMDTHVVTDYLYDHLPEYMVPKLIKQLEQIPLTSTGKIDQAQLPELQAGPDQRNFIPARNEIEEQLIEAWQEVFKVELIGIHDNFFILGGDSIRAIQIAAYLNKYHLRFDLKDLFKHSTIAELSPYVSYVRTNAVSQEPVIGEAMLTPIQRWFFGNGFYNINHWNQSVLLFANNKFVTSVVQKVIHTLVRHHDALRMCFPIRDNKRIQVNMDIEHEPQLLIHDFLGRGECSSSIEETASSIQSSINIEAGPLYKFALFHTDYGDYLLVVIHHLIVDGISWRILLEDFDDGYMKVLKGEGFTLPQKTFPYLEWADIHSKYVLDKRNSVETTYWKKINSYDGPQLVTDFANGNGMQKDTQTIEVSLTEEWTERLLKQARQAYNTEINDLLVASLGLALFRWKRMDKTLVQMEGHGREELTPGIDMSRTVGWFTSIYPIQLEATDEMELSFVIKSVKEMIRQIPNNGVGYSSFKYLEGEDSVPVIPDVSFNYLGQFDENAKSGLFTISESGVGESIDPRTQRLHKIDLVSIVKSNQLVITIGYSQNQYRQASVQAFSNHFVSSLQDIIRHCCEKGNTEFTPTDFGNDKLTFEEVDHILDMVNDLN